MTFQGQANGAHLSPPWRAPRRAEHLDPAQNALTVPLRAPRHRGIARSLRLKSHGKQAATKVA